MPNTSIELLKKVARRLGPLLPEVALVGGCATGLLITDAAGAEVRPTFDVIAEITSYAGYEAFSERLRSLGFEEDVSEGAPQCRWLVDGMKLDVMPLDEKILAFTNRWYRGALTEAKEIEVEPKLRIRVITAPYFIATKLEAYNGRGRGDYTSSHDLEDLLAVIDGREETVSEIARAGEVRAYIAGQFRALLEIPAFVEALPGYLLPGASSQNRLSVLSSRIKEISQQ
jgi:hypothetical protein